MKILMYGGLTLAALTLLFATVVFAFLGRVIDPIFWVFNGVLVVGVAAIAAWWRRDARGAAPAGLDDVDTEILDRAAIANHQPAVPAALRAHRLDAAWWRKVRNRSSRTKEGASR